MHPGDRLSSFFWLLIAIFICVISTTLGLGKARAPGPGFLLFWTGIVLGFLSIILLTKSIVQARTLEEMPGLSSSWKGMKWGRVVFVFVVLLVYTVLLPLLGFLIATSILLIVLFSILGMERLWLQAVVCVMIALVSYLIFSVCLGIPFPQGILGI